MKIIHDVAKHIKNEIYILGYIMVVHATMLHNNAPSGILSAVSQIFVFQLFMTLAGIVRFFVTQQTKKEEGNV